MTIKTCDKCGAEIIKNPVANLKLPTFTILKFENYISGFQSVDLCTNCEYKLNEWLSNKEEPQVSENHHTKNCPLIEIPTPHGRLIDADALFKLIEKNSYILRGYFNSLEKGMFLGGIKQAIDQSPTIIEAVRREERCRKNESKNTVAE